MADQHPARERTHIPGNIGAMGRGTARLVIGWLCRIGYQRIFEFVDDVVDLGLIQGGTPCSTWIRGYGKVRLPSLGREVSHKKFKFELHLNSALRF